MISELAAKVAYRACITVDLWFYGSSGKHVETGKVSVFSKGASVYFRMNFTLKISLKSYKINMKFCAHTHISAYNKMELTMQLCLIKTVTIRVFSLNEGFYCAVFWCKFISHTLINKNV